MIAETDGARGRFIVIEGLDGSGGTTQVRLLSQALAATATREPTDGPIGKLIRQSLAEPMLLGDGVLPYLFAADRKDHLERLIEPKLAAGVDVVSDRYLHSSLAYQSLAMPFEQVFALNADFRAPDLCVMLELPVAQCLERIEARGQARDRFETEKQLVAISEQYERVLAHLEARGDRILRLDASQSIKALHKQILDAVQSLKGG
ncbi:MAG: dTMP kinase [Myxococcota bacterium]|nr:dTMP kinase [Myxococcota bacterium]